MTDEQKNALDVVDKLNADLYDLYGEDNFDDIPIVSIVIADYMFAISLNVSDDYEGQEIKLYNSENNDMIYNENTDTYEDLYVLLKRRFKEIKKMLNKIQL